MPMSFGTARAAALAILSGLSALGSPPAMAAGSPSVIELFTSQGCSSCPPADEVLAALAKNPDLIAISLPVDYWDYLGWKDTFAKPAFTERQRGYSAARGDRQVYTPQAVINGREHANGASRGEIARAVAATAPGLNVPVGLVRKGDSVVVTVGAAGAASKGTIWVMPVIGQREVAIGRGENARRKVVYTNIVREVAPIGDWTGAATNLAVTSAQLKDADSVVVIVQAGTAARPGPILGAAQLALR